MKTITYVIPDGSEASDRESGAQHQPPATLDPRSDLRSAEDDKPPLKD
jgi:hypothetical protein